MAGSKKSKAKPTPKVSAKGKANPKTRPATSAKSRPAPPKASPRKKPRPAAKSAPSTRSRTKPKSGVKAAPSQPKAHPKARSKAPGDAKPQKSSRTAPGLKPAPKTPKSPAEGKPSKLSKAFLDKQRSKLLILKDSLLDLMHGVARDNLHARAEGSEASAFGLHQADAGSDAYDRDFALSLLSKDQDSLYQIDEALKRIELGTYGICEMSGKPIPQRRLEALPFTRYTVECQAEIERQNRLLGVRQPVTSLFGVHDDEGEDGDDDGHDNKD